MDILTHTTTGALVGSLVASNSKKGIISKIGIICFATFAGALPDIDAISLWSHFDSSIGSFFKLEHSGKYIYSAKLWYSHHGFFHSILAAILFAFVFVGLGYLIRRLILKHYNKTLANYLITNKPYLIAFIIAYTFHLIEDMPTPASTWGGVRLLFPLDTYFGGWGNIWWWNNYDILLIIASATLINFISLVVARNRKIGKLICTSIFLVAISWSCIQIFTRPYDFSYENRATEYQEMENESLRIQQEILGENMYDKMHKFDTAMPFLL